MVPSQIDNDRIRELKKQLENDLSLELPDDERYETITTITIRDVANVFGVSVSAVTKSLRKRCIKPELIDDEVYRSNGAVVKFKVNCLLGWQVDLALEVARDVYYRSIRRPSTIRCYATS